MKKIQPIQIWFNGQNKTASFLSATSISDNLKDTAVFYWQLFEAIENTEMQGQQLAQGNLTLSGTDYETWNNEPDANAWAYSWIAEQLDLTLI